MFLIMQNCFLITLFASVKLRFLAVMGPLGYPEVGAEKLVAHTSDPSSSRAHGGDPGLLAGCTQGDSGRELHSQVPHTTHTHTLILSPAKRIFLFTFLNYLDSDGGTNSKSAVTRLVQRDERKPLEFTSNKPIKINGQDIWWWNTTDHLSLQFPSHFDLRAQTCLLCAVWLWQFNKKQNRFVHLVL